MAENVIVRWGQERIEIIAAEGVEAAAEAHRMARVVQGIVSEHMGVAPYEVPVTIIRAGAG